MAPKHNYYIKTLVVLFIVIILILLQRQSFQIYRPISTVDLYANARLLRINGSIDPPCLQSRNIFYCAGYCPWYNTDNNKLVSCSFLPRILHMDFIKYHIYCTPDIDHCPDYNSWLKDDLAPTTRHIERIPNHLLTHFTLNYSIQVDYSTQQFRPEDLWAKNWTVELIEQFRKEVRARKAFGSYNNKDIYPALDKYASLAIKDKKCAVIGTENPWIEAALLEYNASSVTTIEYATILSNVPRLFTITPTNFVRQQKKSKKQRQIFDSVWSYSSLEHDGLGRYRDPLNPYGDLQTMIKISCILKPGGLLFLSVPLHIEDFIQFNLHRLYGPIRLPLLYRNFHIVEILGPEMAKNGRDFGVQPFVVLQNKIGCKPS